MTEAYLQNLVNSGKIRAFKVSVGRKALNANSTAAIKPNSQNEAKGITHIKQELDKFGIKYENEYRFSKRRFRFDIAIPSLMTAIEYNGIFSEKSRHTTVTGYSKDREKVNLAITLGWRVLEYTPLNYKNFPNDFTELNKNKHLNK